MPVRGGDLVRVILASRRMRLAMSYVFASLILEKLLDVLTLVVMATISVFVFTMPQWLEDLLIIASAFVIIGIALCILIARRGFVRIPVAVQRYVPVPLLTRLEALLGSFRDGLHALRSPRTTMTIFALSLVSWIMVALGAWFVAVALGIRHVNPATMLIVTAVISLGQIIPSSPGAIGTYELLGVSTLALFAIAREPALEFTFVLHVLSIMVQVGLGLIGLAWLEMSARGAVSLPVEPISSSCDAMADIAD
jgi:uncharacterized protein (TIRG00374 family)